MPHRAERKRTTLVIALFAALVLPRCEGAHEGTPDTGDASAGKGGGMRVLGVEPECAAVGEQVTVEGRASARATCESRLGTCPRR